MTDLEHTFREAFKMAEKSRREAGGFRAREMKFRKGRNGKQRLDGPHRYLVSLYLPAWNYVDVLRHMEDSGFEGSLTKFLIGLVDAHVPHVADRPKPKGERAERVKARAAAKNGRHLRVAA